MAPGITADSKARLTNQQFEARLALGDLERKTGNLQGSRAHLEQLKKEATSKGFLLIAKKAALASLSGS